MMESKFITTGRVFFGICITGIGLIHFIVPGVRPVIAPLPPEHVWQPLGYLLGVALTSLGVAILFNRYTHVVALLLGFLLILFFLIAHLPQRITNQPGFLGYWTDALKLMALGGGAFVLARISGRGEFFPVVLRLDSLARIGKYLFSIMLVVFGIDHFLYTDLIKTLVPAWIPGPVLWTYITGVALIGSGLFIMVGVMIRLICNLLAAMLFLWLVVLHLPAAADAPFADGNMVMSSLQCMAFCGIALMIPGEKNSG